MGVAPVWAQPRSHRACHVDDPEWAFFRCGRLEPVDVRDRSLARHSDVVRAGVLALGQPAQEDRPPGVQVVDDRDDAEGAQSRLNSSREARDQNEESTTTPFPCFTQSTSLSWSVPLTTWRASSPIGCVRCPRAHASPSNETLT